MTATAIECEWPTAEKVRALRLRADLTQAQAAELVGLGARTRWCDYEAGRNQIDWTRWLVFLLLTDQHPTHHLRPRGIHG